MAKRTAPWFERQPERYAAEVQALKALPDVENLEEVREGGILGLRVRLRMNERTLDLVVTYPDNYPYFRPQIAAVNEHLGRHQSGPGGDLCLLGRRTGNWDQDMTAAWLIEHKLPRVYKAVELQGARAAADVEEMQGEPFSTFYPYITGGFVLIDSSWAAPHDKGFLTLGFREPLLRPSEGSPVFQGAVLAVRDHARKVVARSPKEWESRFTGRLSMPWFRLPAVIEETDQEKLIAALPPEVVSSAEGGFVRLASGGEIHVVGVVFPEELRWQESGDGWAFLVRYRGSEGEREQSYLVKPYRYGVEDVFARVPELHPLRTKRIVVVGTGCLGAPSVLEFARAGAGELWLIDHDELDPAGSVRWPLGLANTAENKVDALAGFIRSQYPYTRVRTATRRIGSVRSPDEEPEQGLLYRFLDGAHLVYDASAEFGVSNLLGHMAAELAVPYVAVTGTPGGWGGKVSRVVPDDPDSACWNCLQHHLAGDAATIPDPPSSPDETFQPLGCADPTFTGAGFDMAALALLGVRMAISTLTAAHERGYPELPWHVQVISLRDTAGTPTFTVDPYVLTRHPDCRAHDQAA